jgi:O-antigen/teichoic acid export membrane protein
VKSKFLLISFFTFIAVLIRYSLNIVITREFGFENFAYYQLIINYGNLLGVLFSAGFGLLALQSFSGNKIYHLEYENFLVHIYFGVVGAITLSLIILALTIDTLAKTSIFLVVISALCFSFNKVITQGLLGLRKQIVSVVLRDLSMPTTILLLIFLTTLSMDQFVFSRSIILFISALIGLLFILYKSRYVSEARTFTLRKIYRPINYQYLKVLFKNVSINVVRLLNDKIDVFVAPIFLTPLEFGSYMFVRTFLSIFGIPFATVSRMYSPEVRSLIGAGRNIGKERKFKNLNRIVSILLVAMGFVLWSQFVNINALLGVEITFSHNFMFFLILAYLAEPIFGQNLALLTFSNLRTDGILSLSITFGLSIIFTSVLIYFFSTMGAAISVAITALLKNSLLDYFCRKRLGLSPSFLSSGGR